MNGDELARAVQREALGIPVVMMSGNISDTDKRKFIDEEKIVLAVLNKPFAIQEFKAVVAPLSSSSPVEDKVGGIDLNPAQLNLQIRRDGNGVPLPVNLQPIGTMQIDGFVPVIIQITPVLTLPLLSAVTHSTAPNPRLSRRGQKAPLRVTLSQAPLLRAGIVEGLTNHPLPSKQAGQQDDFYRSPMAYLNDKRLNLN